MKLLVIIFIIIASIAALSSLTYVIVDIIIELKRKEEEPERVPEPVIIPVPVPEPEHVVIETVEHVDAEEADQLLSDDVAISQMLREPGGGTGYRAYINIGVIDQNFEAGEVITLQVLKNRGLVENKAGRVKVLADGVLSKAFTIKAESYSIQAIKMIELTGGTPIILE